MLPPALIMMMMMVLMMKTLISAIPHTDTAIIHECTHRDEALPNGKPPRAGAAGAAPPQGAGADAKVLPPLRVQRSDSLKGQEDGQVEMPWWMYGPKVWHGKMVMQSPNNHAIAKHLHDHLAFA